MPHAKEPTLTRRQMLTQTGAAAAALSVGSQLADARAGAQEETTKPGEEGNLPACDVPWIKGRFRHVLYPTGATLGKLPPETWYINDHCFVVAADKTIHWYGITNPYSRGGNPYGPGTHRHIGHASAAQPFGPWTAHEHALALPEGTEGNIGAPFVQKVGAKYYMYYGCNKAGLSTAVSDDLFTWKPLEDVPKIDLGASTRDPCVLKLDDGRMLMYAAANDKDDASGVGLAESTGGLKWERRPHALRSDIFRPWCLLESPAVIRHGELYYLFSNHSHHQYAETVVYASRDPFTFDYTKPLGTLFAHAAEFFDFDGKTYISHCGIEDQHWRANQDPNGLWLAELGWLKQ